ncbi:nicotinate-nucleotide--dimethylbenzimidazole phosphoribosyltransferase [Rhodomicrobium udaipurense JA643]|uniref:Nicotinate-nucleotide--dimethylbenzimidazole phosphoribosyltransferase n=1 Tax=Rhodomicrobium udaipurense TaxID=1202716 RepID=A0A8I1KKK4_9HYPH|nr:nicotinate-nucleotide--dimethylbenzimidazole phosphoribosyltransferase [Rhodomicrobium udaipurense]KAI96097.1 nicotinate-nucleotide--dimethylbenzimidazole phosphoribosyltransferase [Rhodomicrobium udaipurense JA643]MBJ7544179.1 nicotinate-nucleotide--dimethylbenzimidazole phosphoribosyltransferase [Rhodomicrobium udaipurense]
MHKAERFPSVTPLSRDLEPTLRAAIDQKAKPIGSLGRIETLAIHAGLITQSLKPDLGRAALAIFAADHGIVAEGVTAYPAEISTLVTGMACDGKAGGNIAAKGADVEVFVIDAGLRQPHPPHPRLTSRRIGPGTRDFLLEAAMTDDELGAALRIGFEIAHDLKAQGFGMLALGEIGIGNTSSAALVAHCVTKLPLDIVVGPGAGAPPAGLQHKRDVLARSFTRAPVETGLDALREFGGYEIAMMAGAMFGAAHARQVVIVDGFIATAAACAAVAIDPNLRDYLLFSHQSAEPGHVALMQWLNAEPFFSFGMRLGEGTGAVLVVPMLRMAQAMLDTMADLPGPHPTPSR